jgi:FPC/CPF motif-containing protein YcgG
MSAVGMRRRSKRWQRERIVGSTFSGSVVANMNFTCAGGSSSVLSSALNAAVESM